MGIKFVPTCDHFPSLPLKLAQKGFFMTGFFPFCLIGWVGTGSGATFI